MYTLTETILPILFIGLVTYFVGTLCRLFIHLLIKENANNQLTRIDCPIYSLNSNLCTYQNSISNNKKINMTNIKKQYLKLYGYFPTDNEVLNLYYQGAILLTDKQENQLIKYFNLPNN